MASEARGHTGQRASLSLPGTLVLGIAMGALGGWVWLTPAVVCAGAAVWRKSRAPPQRPRGVSNQHARSISTSDRQMARRSSSSLSTSNCLRICCICLDDIPEDEPKVEHFDCGHGAQTHKACIDMWLKKQDTCPLCRRDVKEPVLEDMLAKPLNVDAQLKGCRFIMVKGWRNEAYQKHFLEMGAAELVLKAMRNLVEHPELQASACGAIFVLTFAGADMQDSLAALGAGDLIITAMRAFPWDCVLQTQGCQAVYGLARNNPNNQRSLATGGACGAVLDALDRFFDSSLELTAAGAEAIMAMAFDDAENQSLLARGGAAEGSRPNARGVCEILTDATGRYQGACDVLYVILDGVMKCAIEHGENQRRFGNAGMCELIMEAMDRFDSEEEFVLVALTALYTLTDNCKENQIRVLAHGGGTGGALLVDLIERHSSNRDLLSVGLEAIFSLTYDRDEGAQLDHQSALREARVCELLLRLLKSHGSDAEVYATAIKVAACLVASPESAERLGGAEGCGAIGQVMAHALRRDDRVSVDMCCRVVTTLSSGNADHQRLFAELGVCELTCDSIRRGLSTYEALGAIAELACSCPENKERLGKAGACGLVLKTLQENFNDAVCQDSSCVALAHLCQDCPANVALLREEEFRIPGSPSDSADSPPVRICTLLGDMLRDSGGRGAQSICVIMLALSALCTGPDGPNADCQAECGPMTCRAAVQRLKEAAPEDELVIRHGVQLLADLALLCPENQRVLEEAGAVEAVVERFQAEIEKEDASTAPPMLQALATLSEQHEPIRQRCVDLRVLEQALQLHKRLPDDEAALDGVLALYSTVISGNRGFQEKAVSCGICDVLVATVVHHTTDSQMLTRCSSLVLALTELEVTDANGHVLHLWKSTDQSNKEVLRCAGGVSAFTAALMANQDIDDPWLISFLILVLALLADDSDATVATLRSTGASDLVTRLHQRHCAHETLPMSVAGFVSNCVMSFTGHWDVAELAELFAVRREEQEWFLRNGFLALILKMLRRRPMEKWMVITAMTALISLVWGNAAAVDDAIAHGALEVIASVMEERKDAPSVVFHCGLALAALTTGSRPIRDTPCWGMADNWCRRPRKKAVDPCTESLSKLLKRHLNELRRVASLQKHVEELGTRENGSTLRPAGGTDGA